jgi:hypothetical protein
MPLSVRRVAAQPAAGLYDNTFNGIQLFGERIADLLQTIEAASESPIHITSTVLTRAAAAHEEFRLVRPRLVLIDKSLPSDYRDAYRRKSWAASGCDALHRLSVVLFIRLRKVYLDESAGINIFALAKNLAPLDPFRSSFTQYRDYFLHDLGLTDPPIEWRRAVTAGLHRINADFQSHNLFMLLQTAEKELRIVAGQSRLTPVRVDFNSSTNLYFAVIVARDGREVFRCRISDGQARLLECLINAFPGGLATKELEDKTSGMQVASGIRHIKKSFKAYQSVIFTPKNSSPDAEYGPGIKGIYRLAWPE